MCSQPPRSTLPSPQVPALFWWPVFWSTLATELARNMYRQSGMWSKKIAPPQLSVWHNATPPPTPNSPTPARKRGDYLKPV